MWYVWDVVAGFTKELVNFKTYLIDDEHIYAIILMSRNTCGGEIMLDVQYLFLFQFLLFIIIFVGIQYISGIKEAGICRFLIVVLAEAGNILCNRFSKTIGKEKIHAYDKYQMWRYIEHRRTTSFTYE